MTNHTTQELEIESRIQDALNRDKRDLRQLIASLLAVVSLTVGVVLWETNEHAEIRDWTAGQDYVTREELKELIKDQYVPRVEFVVVKEKLDNLTKKHDEVLNAIDKMDKKLDSLEDKGGRKR